MKHVIGVVAGCGLTFALSLSGMSNVASAQGAGDVFNIFRGLMQSTMTQAALQEWQKLPATEISCIENILQAGGTHLRRLVEAGITPADPRLADVRASCRRPVDPPRAGVPANYVVDGRALGEQIDMGAPGYLEYSCGPSEQFPGLTWCQKKRSERERRGAFTSSYSILHSNDGTALYLNRYLEPAFFDPGEVEADLQRLSRRYGEPRLIEMTPRSDLPRALMAVWGDAVLEPLDAESRDVLAAGRSPRKGILYDFIGDFTRSVRNGLPVYRVAGGAGYVWAASFDQRGRGTLRFSAIRADALLPQPSPPVSGPAAPAAEAPRAPPPASPPEKDIVDRANEGQAAAQFELAMRYRQGRGVPRSDADALEWLRKAADQGLAPAQKALADAYAAGQGIAQDNGLAVTWYRRAAEQGLADAQYRLAVALEGGVGTQRDGNAAFEWFTKAAAGGQWEAKARLDAVASQQRGLRAARQDLKAQADVVPDPERRRSVEELVARLQDGAEANDLAELDRLRANVDAAQAAIKAGQEFRRLQQVAADRLTAVSAAMDKVTFDAPMVSDIRNAITSLRAAQSGTDLEALRAALSVLERVYNSGALTRLKEARDRGFETVEEWDRYRADQERLGRSGIRLKPR